MEKFKEYLRCARAHSYPAAIAPVLVGATYSLFYIEKFDFFKFFIFLIACLLIQTSTNYFNEYYDFKLGLDKVDSQGISGSIVHGRLKPQEVFKAAVILYIVALILGLYLASLTSYYILPVGLMCMLVGYLYTGGKSPIAYGPYGEVAAGFFMGTIIIALSFYVQTGFVNLSVILLSIPLFLMIGNILLANSIRDAKNDEESGRRTLAIVVGKKRSVEILTISFLLVYLSSVALIFINNGTIFYLLVLVSIPLAIKVIKGLAVNKTKETMAPFMVLTAKMTIIIGFTMALANILNYYI
ncbi:MULTISPECIES: 1,4-dihydroxy-2-naphthoate polyprenyltransferase [unclassified Gemella]|uniref:1,4-dihydroxy-2-naphthoate polyprenyltransferase n=1 Tax=unclassified Gemella TaxID=2624949 RepID=UPI0015D0AE79|nr:MULTISPECIES: 1,4-dihydroxy-2-naphthoate polyprenyltransferase [unclassified Gemella]MBF0710051.1 1,4-dihydroxy-2-naphthoate polyprenyltransferase [Gemella sp. GL1.1]NYS27395.1 1,4-dihydroxy-2-naphthoate polyprenyltransferase [Gemella sp. GL1]